MKQRFNRASALAKMQAYYNKLDSGLDFAGWVEKTICKQAACLVADKQGRQGLVLFRSRYERWEVAVLFDGEEKYQTADLRDLECLAGDIRRIYRPPLPYSGKSALMGGIACGIKSGRLFRGR